MISASQRFVSVGLSVIRCASLMMSQEGVGASLQFSTCRECGDQLHVVVTEAIGRGRPSNHVEIASAAPTSS